jgi:hypothetical protein
MSGYFTISATDNGKVLGFPLLRSDGNANDFTGASATLKLKFQDGSTLTRSLIWNPNTMEWEYSVIAGEFAVGRWRAMVAVTWPGSIGPINSTEVIFDVVNL